LGEEYCKNDFIMRTHLAHGTNGNCAQNFYCKIDTKTPTGKHRNKLVNNVQVHLQEKLCEGMGWIHLAYDDFAERFSDMTLCLYAP
jgi:uncharacterized protein YuzB (UPF0349 family)